MRTRLAAFACILGAVLALTAFGAEAEWYGGYAPTYGGLQIGPDELALRLNLLLLAFPAAVLVAVAVGLLAAGRVTIRFHRLGSRYRALTTAALAALVAIAVIQVRVNVLREAPLTDDENAYAFQARLIETGRMWVPSAPERYRRFFDNMLIVNDGRRYAPYFVGHSAAMALASFAGGERWLGSGLAAAVLLLAVAVANRLYGSRVAVLTGVLVAISPMFVGLFATRLSQPTSAALVMAGVYALVRVEERPSDVRWWFAATAAFVGGMLTRPQTALPLGVALFGPVVWRAVRGRLGPVTPALVAFCVTGALGAIAFAWCNAVRTGSILRTGYAAYMDQGHPWTYPVGVGPSLRQLSEGLGHLSFWLFGWPVSLVFVPFFGRRPFAVRLGCGALAAVLSYAVVAVPTVAPVGPAYYGELVPILAILSAAGIESAVAWARERLRDRPWVADAVAFQPAAFAMIAAVTFLPAHYASLSRMGRVDTAVYDLVRERGLRDAVVFVEGWPGRAMKPGSFAYSFHNADPDLADPVLYVRDLGPQRDRELFEYLPNRRGYVLRVVRRPPLQPALALEPLP